MALFRALETARPGSKRLFADPLAHRFLSPSLRAVVRLSRLPLASSPVARFIDWRWPGARASGIARTRLIDDALAAALSAGAEQVVILGAGFDSRAYRIRGVENARVFEVDHPVTLSAKKNVLGRIPGLPLSHVRFVEIDFNQSLDKVMARSGFDRRARTFFIWEDNQLPDRRRGRFHAVLPGVGRRAGQQDPLHLHPQRRPSRPVVVRRRHEFGRWSSARAGERWTFGIDPSRLSAYLAERGLDLIEDAGSLEFFPGPATCGLRART